MITLTHFLYTNLYILFFWGFYKLILQNEKQFRVNRLILLLAVPIATILPFGHQAIADYMASYQTFNGNTLGTGFNVLLNEVTIGIKAQGIEKATINYFLLVIISGSIFSLIGMLIGHIKIMSLIKRSKAQSMFNIRIRVSSKSIVPFSYFKSIVIPKSVPKEERHMIIMHESFHIRFMHYIDTYLLQIFQIVFWMNPFFYLLKRELKQIHEFEVDAQVINAGIDAIHYKVTLVKFSVGSHKFKLANGLTNYPLKKRLIMINNPKQTRNTWKYVMLFPVLAIAVTIISACNKEDKSHQEILKTVPEREQSQTEKYNPKDEIVVVGYSNITQPVVKLDENDNLILIKPDENGHTTKEEVFMVVEKMPKFPGGNKAIMEFLASNIKYPVEAQENGIQGRVYVNFVIDKEGNVIAPKITRGVDPRLDIEALRVVKSMPQWEPGTQRGKQVNISYTLPINFLLQ